MYLPDGYIYVTWASWHWLAHLASLILCMHLLLKDRHWHSRAHLNSLDLLHLLVSCTVGTDWIRDWGVKILFGFTLWLLCISVPSLSSSQSQSSPLPQALDAQEWGIPFQPAQLFPPLAALFFPTSALPLVFDVLFQLLFWAYNSREGNHSLITITMNKHVWQSNKLPVDRQWLSAITQRTIIYKNLRYPPTVLIIFATESPCNPS